MASIAPLPRSSWVAPPGCREVVGLDSNETASIERSWELIRGGTCKGFQVYLESQRVKSLKISSALPPTASPSASSSSHGGPAPSVLHLNSSAAFVMPAPSPRKGPVSPRERTAIPYLTDQFKDAFQGRGGSLDDSFPTDFGARATKIAFLFRAVFVSKKTDKISLFTGLKLDEKKRQILYESMMDALQATLGTDGSAIVLSAWRQGLHTLFSEVSAEIHVAASSMTKSFKNFPMVDSKCSCVIQ